MSVIHLPRRNIVQPQGLLRSAREDARFLYCGGSVGASSLLPTQALDTSIPDLVSDTFPTSRYTTDPRVALTPFGVGVTLVSSQQGYGWLPPISTRRQMTLGTANDATTECTIVWFGYIPNNTASQAYYSLFVNAGAASVSGNGTWNLRRHPTLPQAVGFRVVTNGAYTEYLGSDGSLPRDEFVCLVVRIRNDTLSIYSNGKLALEQAFEQPLTGSSAAVGRIRIGSDSYTYNNYFGNIALLAGFYGTPFADDEIARVSKDPYSLIASRPRRIYFDMGMTGGTVPTVPILSLPGVIEITGRTARPRITLTYSGG